MQNQYSLKKKKDLIIFLLQILFLICSLIGILWSQNFLRKRGNLSRNQLTKRNAELIVPIPKPQKILKSNTNLNGPKDQY